MRRRLDQSPNGPEWRSRSHARNQRLNLAWEMVSDTSRWGHLLGYARVSTFDQNPNLQRDALKAAGCFRIFTDKASGTLDNRKELAKVLDQLRPGDTLVVRRLDRLGRSLRHLINTITARRRTIPVASIAETVATAARRVGELVSCVGVLRCLVTAVWVGRKPGGDLFERFLAKAFSPCFEIRPGPDHTSAD
jgi:Resolvase, N terminal domain